MDSEKRTPLHLAAEENRLSLVKFYLIRGGVDVDACDIFCKTALTYAVEKANLEMVEFILKFRPAVNIEANRNALYAAINSSMYEAFEKITKILIDYGFRVCAKDRKAADVLHQAIEQGRFEAVKTLLDLGADVNTLNRFKIGVTPLHAAVKHRHLNITELLLRRRANVSAKTSKGKYAFCYAVKNNDKSISKLLLTGDVASTGVSTYHLNIAVSMDSREMVELLLERALHIDIFACDLLGLTALHYAAVPPNISTFTLQEVLVPSKIEAARPEPISTRADIAKMFLIRGVSANVRASEGVTPLHLAAYGGYSEVAQALLEHGADVCSVTTTGLTPLHLAASRNNAAVATLLLNHGAAVNAVEAKGRTPLHSACESGHVWMVPLLVERGANLEAGDFEGLVPLHVAAQKDNSDVVEMLLHFKANIEAREHSGKTALHLATTNSKPAVVKILVDNGADVNATCNDLKTPMDYAGIIFDERHQQWNAALRDYSQNRRSRAIVPQLYENQGDLNDQIMEIVRIRRRPLPIDELMLRRLEYAQNQVQRWIDRNGVRVGRAHRIAAEPRVEVSRRTRRFVQAIRSPRDLPLSYEEFCRKVFYADEDALKVGQIIEQRVLALTFLELVTKGETPGPNCCYYEEEYFGYCRLELDRMRQKKIGNNNVTFYELVAGKENKLACYANNSKIAEYLDSTIFALEFPIYSQVLYKQLKLGFKRMNRFRRGTQSLSALSRRHLTYPIATEILRYLSNADLDSLSAAG